MEQAEIVVRRLAVRVQEQDRLIQSHNIHMPPDSDINYILDVLKSFNASSESSHKHTIEASSYKMTYPSSGAQVATGEPTMYNGSFDYGSPLPTMTGQMQLQQNTMNFNTSTTLREGVAL